MLSSYGNEQPQVNNSYNFNNSIMTATSQEPTLNSYGNQYVNTVRENRSKYGNYLDNSLSYDPHKEQKAAFNVVYADNVYNPWGKPGGGAPKLNKNTGQLQNKIAGTLQWNLTGESEQERVTRVMANRSHTNQNLHMYKKNAEGMSPRNSMTEPVRTNTTYNYNFREPIEPNFNKSQSNKNSQNFDIQSAPPPKPQQTEQQVPNFPMSSPGRSLTMLPTGSQSMDFTRLSTEANMRSINRAPAGMSQQAFQDSLRPKGYQELNRTSNKLHTDNQPSNHYPNMSYWFGRAGQHKTTIDGFSGGASQQTSRGSSDFSSDPRRRRLMDSLENRSPRDAPPKVYGLDNSQLPKQNTNLTFVNDSHSNHRNNYENF